MVSLQNQYSPKVLGEVNAPIHRIASISFFDNHPSLLATHQRPHSSFVYYLFNLVARWAKLKALPGTHGLVKHSNSLRPNIEAKLSFLGG